MRVPVDSGVVRRNFGRQAGEYERHAVVQRTVAAHLTDLLDATTWPAAPILEVGCGTGLLSRRLQSRRGSAPLILSDLAHAMTCRAVTGSGAGLAVDADAAALPFAPSSFGLLASSSVYQWLNCLPSAFAEGARVLVPGGVLAVALFGARTLHELRASHRRAREVCRTQGPSHLLEFAAEAEVRDAVTAAGLQLEAFESAELIEMHPDVPALLRGLKGLGASNAAAVRPAGLTPRQVMTRMLAFYQEEFGTPAGIPATYQVFYLLARRP